MDSRAILSMYWRSEVSNWSHNTYPVSAFPPNFRKRPAYHQQAYHLWILCMAHGNYSLFFSHSSWISFLEIMCCNLSLSTYTAVCSTYLIPELQSSSFSCIHMCALRSFNSDTLTYQHIICIMRREYEMYVCAERMFKKNSNDFRNSNHMYV